MKKTLLSWLITVMAGTVSAQSVSSDSLFRFSGYVMGPADNAGIPNAHVLNLSKGTGTVTSLDGSFELHVRNADSLKISCVGYVDRYLIIRKHILREEAMIYLEKDTVMMDELLVHQLGPRRFFKYTFLNLNLPEEEEEFTINPAALMFRPGEGPVPPTGIIVKGPVQLLYDVFNKNARLRRKVKRYVNKHAKHLEAAEVDSLVNDD
ncbi:MAG TPA: carboxypeptidase-like regulatory domain-containing protein [Bacteroidales bacterium]|nr:carboxypeptidase-like regulatory domain-containing protein [Bacteroidales bacterium]